MVYINKLYTVFTNAFSCIKTNSILFTVPMILQVAIPQYSSQEFGLGISSALYLQKMYIYEYKHVT